MDGGWIEREEMLDYVPEVIRIIKNISNEPSNNFITWNSILTIIYRIPNHLVPVDLLEYMPTWTNNNVNNSLISNTILENLLPKFLTVSMDINDKEKALLILKNIFTLYRITPSKESNNYFSVYDDYFFIEELVTKGLIKVISENFSIDEVRNLPDSITYILRDHVSRPSFGEPKEQYRLTTKSNFENLELVLEVLDENTDPTTVFEETIDAYLDKDRNWQDQYFKDLFSKYNPVGENTEEILSRATFMLRNDFNSELNLELISDLDENTSLEPTLNMFTLLLREWLVALAINDPEKAKREIRFLLYTPRFDLNYFRRIIVFAISNNWKDLKSIFWEISENYNLFSTDVYKDDITELLSKVYQSLDDNDVKRLKEIFNIGPVGTRHYVSNIEYWKLRWYNALKSHPSFVDDYKKCKAGFKSEPDFANEGRVVVKSGYESPLSIEQMEDMPIKEIVSHILKFKTEDSWNGPDVEGFSYMLGEAAERKPEKFGNEINLFEHVGFPYIYRLLFGLCQGYKKTGQFDLTGIVKFSEKYINDKRFWDGTFAIQEETRTKPEWIFGQIADIISVASKEEQDKFGLPRNELLVNLIWKLTSYMDKTDVSRFTENTDFVMHTLNSTQGKILRSLLDVSLQYKRLSSTGGIGVWNPKLKKAYEDSFSKEILDGYVLEAMFLQQLMYLDEPWLKAQLKNNYNLPEIEWNAFMGGIAFKSPPISPEYYPLMYPHYERAVENEKIDLHHEGGILRHLLAIYFQRDEVQWKQSLLFKAVGKGNATYIEKLISLIIQQRKSVKNLEDPYKSRILKKIFILWDFILEQVKVLSPSIENGFNSMFRFVEFVDENMLNEELNQKIIQTVKFSKNQGTSHMFKEIQRFSKRPENAKHVGRLLSEFEFNYYYEKDRLIEVVDYLYRNGEKEFADSYVTKLAQVGYDFLRPIYLKYNIHQ